MGHKFKQPRDHSFAQPCSVSEKLILNRPVQKNWEEEEDRLPRLSLSLTRYLNYREMKSSFQFANESRHVRHLSHTSVKTEEFPIGMGTWEDQKRF